MSKISIIPCLAFCAALAALAGLARSADKTPAAPKFTAEQVAFYEKQVKPLLAKHCGKCHGGKEPKAGLTFQSRAAVLAGGESGPAVSLTKPDDSRLLKAIHYKDGLEMP